MSKLSPILAPEADRAHYVAQITLSALAMLMLGALAWAGWQGAFPGLMRAAKGEALTATAPAVSKGGMSAAIPPNVLAVNSLPDPVPAPAPVFKKETPPRIGATSTHAIPPPSYAIPQATVSPQTVSPSTSPGTLGGRPITDPQAREMVDAAREVRRLGDMQAALESLRAADLHQPQHPEILSEMALTYEAMHLTDKAVLAWRNVLAMGETAAGGYYNLARSKLEALQDAVSTAAASTEARPLSIGSCQVQPDRTVTKGQRVKLRIPIIAAQGSQIDPSQVDLHVYFFDKLADGTVGPTHADPPSMDWISAPVDWKDDGEELVDVTYNMPELKPEELRNLGKRSYHGYVVKLFYQNKFMGEQAEPRALLDFKPQGAGPAGMNNALFPKN